MTFTKQTVLKIHLRNFHLLPFLPFIRQNYYLLDQFLLIGFDATTKTEVLKNLVNEFNFWVVSIEETKRLFGFGLYRLFILIFKHRETLWNPVTIRECTGNGWELLRVLFPKKQFLNMSQLWRGWMINELRLMFWVNHDYYERVRRVLMIIIIQS